MELIRCSGPNCGVLKGHDDHWWLMWTTPDPAGVSVLAVAPWNDELRFREGALAVCGENCAQKLQSQFMTNLLQNTGRRAKAGS